MYKKSKNPHPSLDIVSSDGMELSGKRIVLCVAGSVAAYKSIELARLLMRHGADVVCVTSQAANRLVQPSYFKWATGNDVITKLTGNLEHIQVADYNKSDLIIVYPTTANTLGKLANGIDDTPISTVLTVGFGSHIPIIMCLAMHQSMYENSAVKRNIEFLRKKVEFISPHFVEDKAKAPEPEEVLDHVLRKYGFSSILSGKKVLITGGPTVENIDAVRIISNESSGTTATLLAANLVSTGADVTLIYGPGAKVVPKNVRTVNVKTTHDMLKAVKKELKKKYDIVIMAAAVADYIPVKQKNTKLKSTLDKVVIEFKRAPKIISQIKEIQHDVFLVGFKAEVNVSKKKLEVEAKKKMKESKSDLIIANDIGTRYKKDPEKNEILIVDGKGSKSSGLKKKEAIAKIIIKEIEKRIQTKDHSSRK